MKIQHFFLSRRDVPVPERWRKAFSAGERLAAPAMRTRLREIPAAQCIVWLSSTDPQWKAHLHWIFQIQPGARVVLLSNIPAEPEGMDALNAGVRGYTHAYGVPTLLQEVALVVGHGGLWVGPDLLQRLVGSSSAALARLPSVPSVGAASAVAAPNAWATLSEREAQVARAVSAGRSNKEVAAAMFISERTVKAHLSAVFEKLGVRDRLQLVLRLSAAGDAGSSSNPRPLP